MKILVAGAGGHGRVVADLAERTGLFSEISFLDDRYPTLQKVSQWEVVGQIGCLSTLTQRYRNLIAAIGDPSVRLDIIRAARAAGFETPALIDPTASVSGHSMIDYATVVCAGAVIQIGAKIGIGCIINNLASIDHDCNLADGVHVCPGAHVAGDVSIGRLSWIGVGACVKQGLTIGAGVTVGAGAAVVTRVRDGATVTGVPAREKGS